MLKAMDGNEDGQEKYNYAGFGGFSCRSWYGKDAELNWIAFPFVS
jgi:hypothetical protein